MSSGGRADEERGGGSGDTVICAACGTENPAGSRFCERCGSRLAQRPAEGARFERPAPPPPPDPGADATVTFQRPPLEPLPGEAPAHEGDPAAAPRREGTPGAEQTIVFRPEGLAQPETISPARPGDEDVRTVAFDLPPTPPPDPDDAATVTFSAPREGDRVPAAEERAAGLPGGEGAEDDGDSAAAPRYDYETWKPAPAAPPPADAMPASVPAPPPAVRGEPSVAAGDEAGSTRLAVPPAFSLPPAASTGADAPPPGGPPAYSQQPPPPRYAPPPPAPTGAPPAYTPPGEGGYGAPATPGAAYQSYPAPQAQAGAPTYGAPGAPAYGAATPYPAAGAQTAGRSNRTLWIILGIVGAVLLLCALACVALIFLGAIGGSAGASAVATGVATATR